MSTSIRKQLRNNPDTLLKSLIGNIHSPETRAVVTTKLDAIREILSVEKEKLERRQQLSRKIGEAKKANEDSSQLIAEVSQLSTEINALKQKIDDGLDSVELEIAQHSSTSDSTEPDSRDLDGKGLDGKGSDSKGLRGNNQGLGHAEKINLPLHLQTPAVASGSTNDHDIANLVTTHESLDTAAWDAFIQACDHDTIYHDQRWQSVIENHFRHDYHLVSCRDQQGSLVGILPMVHVKSRLFGTFTISMPYFNYGGPLAHSVAAEEALLTHAAKLSESIDCEHMEIRETKARNNWESTQRKISMILPLPASDELLDKQLGSKLRAQVKKAESNELTIEFGGVELLNSYYQVFSRNMRDLGTPVYSKKLFAEILENFPDKAFIAVAKQHGKPLAAGFLLGHKDKLEIPWASSVRSKNHLGANMFMYRAILREAIARKYAYFDFGRSTRNATTHRFKKQWGAQEHQLHWHYWTKGDEQTPELNPDNPKFKLAIMVWQRLPVFVTTLIGPPLARNLP